MSNLPQKAPENVEVYSDNYSESGLWSLLKKAGAVVIDPALKLYYVLQDDNTPMKYKTIIMGALGYLILPMDLIPDFTPIFGFTDDAAALYAVIKTVGECITPEVLKKVKDKKKDLGLE